MGFLKYPVPKHEVERRHANVTVAMEKEGIDCLVMYTLDRLFGGTLRYLTRHHETLYGLGATFSKNGEIGIYGWGPLGGKTGSADDSFSITYDFPTPWFPNMHYAGNYVAEQMAKVIKENNYKKIGLCHTFNIPYSVADYLKCNCPDTEFVDASNLVDRIQAVKSDWELEMCQFAVDVQDKVLAAAPCFIRPGQLESDVAKALRAIALDMDCEELNVMVGSGAVPIYAEYFKQHKVIKEGDNCSVLVEVQAPGGFWAESGRVFSLGEPTEEEQTISEFTVYLQNEYAKYLVPGESPAKIQTLLNDELESHHCKSESVRIQHGQLSRDKRRRKTHEPFSTGNHPNLT